MNLNIKNTVLAFLFCSSICIGQEDPSKKSKEYERVGFFSLSYLRPAPIGDSFINKGTEVDGGLSFEFQKVVKDRFQLGVRVESFHYSVTDSEFTGAYNSGNISNLNLVGGYRILEAGDFWFIGNAGIGFGIYKNKASGEKFTESFTTYWAGIEAEYNLGKSFQIFSRAELRTDRLNINAPDLIADSFNKVNYLIFQFGVRLTILNRDKQEKAENIDGKK
tara:strand:- start:5353 stop:6012 length:660 start_codon:yes stop_codon:yes gene_type:complete